MIKKYLLLFAVFVSLLGCSNISSADGYKNISVQEAKILIEQGVLILDVRTEEEVSEGKIDGAINIDFYSDNLEDELDKLDTSKKVLVYCKSGSRSTKTSKMIGLKKNKQVYNLIGGYQAWEKEMK